MSLVIESEQLRESALVTHEGCTEAAVVGIDHPVKGQSIYAFVTLREGCVRRIAQGRPW